MQTSTVILVLSLISISISAFLNSGMDDLVNSSRNCHFYYSLEEKFKCGPNGYPLGYGSKYCSKFLQKLTYFLPNEQKWIDNTLLCLKKQAYESYKNISAADPQKCEKILSWNFNAHPKCYIDNGFCELIKENIVSFPYRLMKNVYEMKDMITLDSVKQIKETLIGCFKSLKQSVNNAELEELFSAYY